jgi:hypothetical protein
MASRAPQDRRQFVHRIDATDRLVSVNQPWLDFARENGWPVAAADVTGSPLSDFIADRETRHIYRLIIQRARSSGRALSFHYRCDSPDFRRHMQMQVHHDAHTGLVEFRNRVLRLESRPRVQLLEAGERSGAAGVLAVCGWCKSAQAGGQWVEVEEAVRRLGLFEAQSLPLLSHGICPRCLRALETEGIRP